MKYCIRWNPIVSASITALCPLFLGNVASANPPYRPAQHRPIAQQTGIFANNGCVPVNKPIPFSIKNGSYNSIDVVGGMIVTNIVPSDMQEDIQNLQLSPNLAKPIGSAIVQPSNILSPPNQVTKLTRNSTNATVTVEVEPCQGSGCTSPGSSDIHGWLTINPPVLNDMINAIFNGRASHPDSRIPAVMPEAKDFCVKSIAIMGKVDDPTIIDNADPSTPIQAVAPNVVGAPKTFHARILLIMNNRFGGSDNYQFDAMNSTRTNKTGSSAAVDGETQLANLPDSTAVNTIF